MTDQLVMYAIMAMTRRSPFQSGPDLQHEVFALWPNSDLR
jgi:hypothetical protein